MNVDIAKIEPLQDFQWQATLVVCRLEAIGLLPHLASPELGAWRDLAYFSRDQRLLGAANGPDGQDTEPETVAAVLKAFESV